MITPRYTGPESGPHEDWRKVKSSAMKRPYLDCGCRNDGRETYLHLGCPRIACKEHANDPHECEPVEPEEPPTLGVLLEVTPGVVDRMSDEYVDAVLRGTGALYGGRSATLVDVEDDVAVYVLDRPASPGELWNCPEEGCTYSTTGPCLRRLHEEHHRTMRTQPRPDAPPVDAVLQPDLDVPSRRPWWGIW